MEPLSEIDQKILTLRQTDGKTIEETINELHIPRKVFQESVAKLRKMNLYNEELIKIAMKRKKNKSYREKNKNKPKLSDEEEFYREKSIDLMCKKYFNYNSTKKLNPLLVKKIQTLSEICSYKVIFNTIKLQERNLDYANTKVFASEFQKINYMIAIIKNNLKIVLQKIERQQKINKRNENLQNNNFINQLNKNIVSKPTNKKDLSSLLDD